MKPSGKLSVDCRTCSFRKFLSFLPPRSPRGPKAPQYEQAPAVVTSMGEPDAAFHKSLRSHRALTCECGWAATGSVNACRSAEASHKRAVQRAFVAAVRRAG